MPRRLPWLACLISAWLFTLPAEARQADEINVFVWKVTPPAGTSSDLLIGTMHMPMTGEKRLPRALDPLFQAADAFFMEADISTVSTSMLLHYSAIAPGKQLKQELSPTLWQRLMSNLNRLGFNEDDVNQLDPWYLNLIVGADTSSMGNGQILDQELQGIAKKLNLRLGYLETAEQQFTMLDSIDFNESLQQLKDILTHPEAPAKQMKELIGAYLDDDLTALESATFQPEAMKRNPDYYQKLFFDRNLAWLSMLSTIFHHNKAIVAVGVGHLIGERGVVRLLEQRGYKVERLPL